MICRVDEPENTPTIEITMAALDNIKYNKWVIGFWTGVAAAGGVAVLCILLAK
jgi:hypothetical protein